jgi:hypothetical protein
MGVPRPVLVRISFSCFVVLYIDVPLRQITAFRAFKSFKKFKTRIHHEGHKGMEFLLLKYFVSFVPVVVREIRISHRRGAEDAE